MSLIVSSIDEIRFTLHLNHEKAENLTKITSCEKCIQNENRPRSKYMLRVEGISITYKIKTLNKFEYP